MLTSHALLVDSSKAKRELGYIETPLDILVTDTLAWMRREKLISGQS